MNVNKYLKMLSEEMGKGGQKRKPSPTFAYELVFNKPIPGGWRSGRYPFPHNSRIWNGIEVDEDFQDEWLDGLNKIKNVEIRGSCAGHAREWIPYISFRVNPTHDKDPAFLNKVASKLNKDKYTKCGWDVGTMERPRFVCATPLLSGKNRKLWEKWWSTLPKRIDKAVNG